MRGGIGYILGILGIAFILFMVETAWNWWFIRLSVWMQIAIPVGIVLLLIGIYMLAIVVLGAIHKWKVGIRSKKKTTEV